MNEKKSHYFMLLVQLGKAGSRALETYYLGQIKELQKEQNKISSKIASHETIVLQDQVSFYNSWMYVAIQSRRALRGFFHLPAKETEPLIDFMIKNGIIIETAGRLKQGSTRVHLPKGSSFLIKHHVNWRMKSIQSLDHELEHDLHYTLVMFLSKNDVKKMKQIIFNSITRADQLLKITGDETVYGMNVDWFQVQAKAKTAHPNPLERQSNNCDSQNCRSIPIARKE